MGETVFKSLCMAGLHDDGRVAIMFSRLSSRISAEYDLCVRGEGPNTYSISRCFTGMNCYTSMGLLPLT